MVPIYGPIGYIRKPNRLFQLARRDSENAVLAGSLAPLLARMAAQMLNPMIAGGLLLFGADVELAQRGVLVKAVVCVLCACLLVEGQETLVGLGEVALLLLTRDSHRRCRFSEVVASRRGRQK